MSEKCEEHADDALVTMEGEIHDEITQRLEDEEEGYRLDDLVVDIDIVDTDYDLDCSNTCLLSE